MVNEIIRREIKAARLHFWQIADRFGLNDGNFSRKLRKELTPEEITKIRLIIKELKSDEDNG